MNLFLLLFCDQLQVVLLSEYIFKYMCFLLIFFPDINNGTLISLYKLIFGKYFSSFLVSHVVFDFSCLSCKQYIASYLLLKFRILKRLTFKT